MSYASGGPNRSSVSSTPDQPHKPPQVSQLSVKHGPPRSRRTRVVYLDHIARLSGGEIALVRLLGAIREDVEAHVILGEDGPLVEKLRETAAVVEVLPMGEDLREARKGAMTARA